MNVKKLREKILYSEPYEVSILKDNTVMLPTLIEDLCGVTPRKGLEKRMRFLDNPPNNSSGGASTSTPPPVPLGSATA